MSVSATIFGVFMGILGLTEIARADESADQAALLAFVQDHCQDCHDGPDGEGGFDIGKIRTQAFHDPQADLHHWIRVFDRVNDGEMPPKHADEIDADQKQAFLAMSYQAIDQTQSRVHADLGRVRSRRLTNDQLQWTLCDLLSIGVPLSELMPDEQRTDGFRNIADAQSMSHYHLEDHLRVVDEALDYAFGRLTGVHTETVREFPADRIAKKRRGQRNRDPELRQGAAVVWTGNTAFYGRITNSTFRDAGWYRITLQASSIKMPDGEGLWCSVRSGQCNSQAPLMSWVGSFEATPDPQTFTFDAWIDEDHMLEIRPGDVTLKKARFEGGQIGFGEGEPQNVPGVAMHSLKIERFFPGGDVDAVKKSLLGDLDVDGDVSAKALKQQIRRFAGAAFRGHVEQGDLAAYLKLADDGAADKTPAVEILRQAYRAILCSPRFVYFTEQPGRLGDHEIANRLSYLLTGRSPDRLLRKAADDGQLTDRDVLVSHVRRLLDGPHLDHFVRDFSDQWLDLADIDFTEPDRRMYGDFDLVVQNAMVDETRRFVQTLIQENLPARSLVDSDFTWLNNRLARYYGISADIEPSTWQRVSLADHPYRGGLMTHGAILKVTANGSNTSPVVRGVWICDRLLGIPIPDPPSNVPAIEPDVRGAKTVRQMLEKHRSQVECASCHARIDPPGFALEHFDAAGRWRDHYQTRNKKSYGKGAPVDSAYQMADGRAFDSFATFRDLAAQDDDRVARNFAAKLLVYGTGHEITFADRKSLDKIVDDTRGDGHRLRSLIESVVTSETFLNK